MSDGESTPRRSGPVLLCFDGSSDAEAAIRQAAELFADRPAVVLTIWEPMRTWVAYDPATILSAPLDSLASHALGTDEILEKLAQEQLERGVELARGAGFEAEGQLAVGTPWQVICDVAQKLDVRAIVVGARGLSRVKSVLLGSVSFAVLTHARRPVLVIPHAGDAQ